MLTPQRRVIVVLTGCLGLLNWACARQPEPLSHKVPTPKRPASEHVASVKVILGLADIGDQVTFDVPITLVDIPWEERLKAAVPLPAQSFTVLGIVLLHFDNRGDEQLILFVPFGTIKRGDKYARADLHELRAYLQSTCRRLDKAMGTQ